MIDHATLFSAHGCRLIIWLAKIVCVFTIIIEPCTQKLAKTVKELRGRASASATGMVKLITCTWGRDGKFFGGMLNVSGGEQNILCTLYPSESPSVPQLMCAQYFMYTYVYIS